MNILFPCGMTAGQLDPTMGQWVNSVRKYSLRSEIMRSLGISGHKWEKNSTLLKIWLACCSAFSSSAGEKIKNPPAIKGGYERSY